MSKRYIAWYRIEQEFKDSGLSYEHEVSFRNTWNEIQKVDVEEPNRTLNFDAEEKDDDEQES